MENCLEIPFQGNLENLNQVTIIIPSGSGDIKAVDFRLLSFFKKCCTLFYTCGFIC